MGNGITLFTIPRAFEGDVGVRQSNAILSWINSGHDVILCGDDPGVVDFAAQVKCWSLPTVERNEWNTPLISDVFGRVQALLDGHLIAYVNADIMLDHAFSNAVNMVAVELDKFLVIGKRHDVFVHGNFDFCPGWQERMRALATPDNIHGPFGIDYFGFRAPLWPEIPPLAVGRMQWDGWLVARASQLGASLVDATGFITIIHQAHYYEHIPAKHNDAREWHANPEIARNCELSGGARLSTDDTDWRFTKNGLVKR